MSRQRIPGSEADCALYNLLIGNQPLDSGWKVLSAWKIDHLQALPIEPPAQLPVLDDCGGIFVWRVTDQTFHVRSCGEADVLVDLAARRIRIVSLAANLNMERLDHFLSDQIIPRILAHLSHTVIHAGAVDIGGRALVLAGSSGQGKSTLTAALDRAGWPLLGDDACILTIEDGRPHVAALYGRLRLLPDSLHGVFPDRPDLAVVARPGSKVRLDPDAAQTRKWLPVAAFLFLAPPFPEGGIRLVPMSGAAATMSLISNAFTLDPGDPGHVRRKMADCTAATQAVASIALHYPRRYDDLKVVREAILSHPAITDRITLMKDIAPT